MCILAQLHVILLLDRLLSAYTFTFIWIAEAMKHLLLYSTNVSKGKLWQMKHTQNFDEQNFENCEGNMFTNAK